MEKFDMELCLGLSTNGGVDAAVDTITRMQQRESATQSTLPLDIRGPWRRKDEEEAETVPEILAAWGIVLGEPTGDRWTQHVTLPSGWVKKATNHTMWTNLLDDKGKIRGRLFQGPFYDRGDFMHTCCRYNVSTVFSDAFATGDRTFFVRVTDCDKDAQLYQTGWIDPNGDLDELRKALKSYGALKFLKGDFDEKRIRESPETLRYKSDELLTKHVMEKLDAFRPGWRSHIKYWETP